MTVASAIAHTHISPRNILFTEDQLTNRSGDIGSFRPPTESRLTARPGRSFAGFCFVSPYPLSGVLLTSRARAGRRRYAIAPAWLDRFADPCTDRPSKARKFGGVGVGCGRSLGSGGAEWR